MLQYEKGESPKNLKRIEAHPLKASNIVQNNEFKKRELNGDHVEGYLIYRHQQKTFRKAYKHKLDKEKLDCIKNCT